MSEEECYRKRGRTYYRENKARQYELIKVRNKQYSARNLALLMLIKNHPCADCRMRYPAWCMDFDHRDGEAKLASVSEIGGSRSNLKKILEEVAKCDVVCAVCHRIRTKNQRWQATFEAAQVYLEKHEEELMSLLKESGIMVE